LQDTPEKLQNMKVRIASSKKKILTLILAGLAVALWLRQAGGLGGWRFLSDLFFVLAMVFFICGLYEFTGNLGAFNSLKYGFKSWRRLLNGKPLTREERRDGYFAYVASRPQYQDIPVMMFFSALFIVVSLGFSLAA
jgi:hypothetical protein